MTDPLQVPGIRNQAALFRRTALRKAALKTSCSGFLFSYPDRQRPFFQKTPADFLHRLRPIGVHPLPHKKLRHGVYNLKTEARIPVFFGRPPDPVRLPNDASQNPVDKSAQIPEALRRSQAHSLVDRRRIRHTVQIADLIDAHPQNFPDYRTHPPCRNPGVLVQNVIQLDSVFDCPLKQTHQKCAVLRSQPRPGFQRVPQYQMALPVLLLRLQKQFQGERTHRIFLPVPLSHLFFPLRKGSAYEADTSERLPPPQHMSWPPRKAPFWLRQVLPCSSDSCLAAFSWPGERR